MGQRLRAVREDKGWSRDLLARKSGTTSLTILRAELHGSDPALSTVLAWADALEVSVAELVEDDGPAAA
jgi:transcriptional regulator with XRE-family HTH domain